MDGAALQLVFTVLGIIFSLARSPKSARRTPNVTELSPISFPSPISSQSMKKVEASLSAVTRRSYYLLMEVALAQGWDKQRTQWCSKALLPKSLAIITLSDSSGTGTPTPPTPPIWSGGV